MPRSGISDALLLQKYKLFYKQQNFYGNFSLITNKTPLLPNFPTIPPINSASRRDDAGVRKAHGAEAPSHYRNHPGLT